MSLVAVFVALKTPLQWHHHSIKLLTYVQVMWSCNQLSSRVAQPRPSQPDSGHFVFVLPGSSLSSHRDCPASLINPVFISMKRRAPANLHTCPRWVWAKLSGCELGRPSPPPCCEVRSGTCCSWAPHLSGGFKCARFFFFPHLQCWLCHFG